MTTEMAERTFGEFQAGREQIVIRTKEFKGKKYLDVRRWYDASDSDDPNPEYRPSKKGCMIPEELVAEAVHAIVDAAATMAIEG